MKKIISGLLIMLLLAVTSFAQPGVKPEKGKGEAVMNGLGFAFQNKDFKTVKFALMSESNASDTANASSGQNDQKKLSGMLVIGGYEYVLKVTLFETVKLEADLFDTPGNAGFKSSSDQQEKEKLPVPLGHVSLTLSQPDPGSSVILGSLRLSDEKVAAVSGEFELYLNDITKKKKSDKK